jgi:RNA polymerase sigma factor for flagellar operon FliA
MAEAPAQTSGSEREQAILEHLPQVWLIARRIHSRLPECVALEDLISAGTIGLIAAIDNFNAGQNVKLKTYAEYKIRGAILDSLRELDWASRQKRRKAKQVEAAIAAAEQRLHRASGEEDIAAEMGLTLEQYHELLVEIQGLDLALTWDGDDDDRDPIKNAPGPENACPALQLERTQLEELLAAGIRRIPDVERTVLSLYYLEEMTLREIGQILSLHESRISHLKSQAIARLRAYMRDLWPARGQA